MENLQITDQFVNRHIGPNNDDIDEMLKVVGVDSIEQLINKTVPEDIFINKSIEFKRALTEAELLAEMDAMGSKNKLFKNFIGMGYSDTLLPSVIKKNILENAGWYTQYTPYQAEISQGRLEALLNFQTMVSDLTGMPLANASLLDEGTAAGEAANMLYAQRKGAKKKANVILVSDNLFPQTIDVVISRSKPLGIDVKVVNEEEFELNDDVYAIMVQYPGSNGIIKNYEKLFVDAKEKNIFCVVAADILSLALLKSPGEFGADCVVGSTQRFGIPLGYGGPHAAFFATKEQFKRSIPGRIIGVSVDSKGRKALRMALQTREQHIKRERATSNICTAQVLLAIMAGMYAVYHGPKGVKRIAERIHSLTSYLDHNLKNIGISVVNDSFFDTITLDISSELTNKIQKLAIENSINLRYYTDSKIGISVSEITTLEDINLIIEMFKNVHESDAEILSEYSNSIPAEVKRTSDYLAHEVFNNYHSETEMMRYIKSLERKDLSLTISMIPLGSCTMKLNAASELYSLSKQEFGNIHPFAPLEQAKGYQELFEGIEGQIAALTGLPGVSLQPNSGAQGEYTGLLVMKAFHEDNGDTHRNIILIPASAHGTNPASAVLTGAKVVIVKCDEKGNVDVEDLRIKAKENSENLFGLMITYPSTHGVFEKEIKLINQIVHDNGGLVYMDGANLNAQVGITNPALCGADVCHLNLHKTFAIPHGGGGPGAGPIAVTEELTKFLPGHSIIDIEKGKSIKAVSSAPWGSASVLTISYAYIRMMGFEGVKKASQIAILNANYIKEKLGGKYKTLYTGENGFVAHELILDTRCFKQSTGVDVEDIAKRLMDYGYHAPTVSFPVPGTLMIEPTESESKSELDKFCNVLEMIHAEIMEIEKGDYTQEDNVLTNAPHILDDVVNEWKHNYSIQKAVAPTKLVKDNKFWPTVGRVDNAYGDRNLVCSCLPIEEYEK